MLKFRQSPEIISPVKSILREPSVLQFWEKASKTGFVLLSLLSSPVTDGRNGASGRPHKQTDAWVSCLGHQIQRGESLQHLRDFFSLAQQPWQHFFGPAAEHSAERQRTGIALPGFVPISFTCLGPLFCFRAARWLWAESRTWLQSCCWERIKAPAAARQQAECPGAASGTSTGTGTAGWERCRFGACPRHSFRARRPRGETVCETAFQGEGRVSRELSRCEDKKRSRGSRRCTRARSFPPDVADFASTT